MHITLTQHQADAWDADTVQAQAFRKDAIWNAALIAVTHQKVIDINTPDGTTLYTCPPDWAGLDYEPTDEEGESK